MLSYFTTVQQNYPFSFLFHRQFIFVLPIYAAAPLKKYPLFQANDWKYRISSWWLLTKKWTIPKEYSCGEVTTVTKIESEA